MGLYIISIRHPLPQKLGPSVLVSLGPFSNEQFGHWMRYNCETPSQGGGSFGVRKFDVVIHNKVREHHLCHDRDIKPPGANETVRSQQHHL